MERCRRCRLDRGRRCLHHLKGLLNASFIEPLNAIIRLIDAVQLHVHVSPPWPLPDVNFDWYALTIPTLAHLAKGTPNFGGASNLLVILGLPRGSRVWPNGTWPGRGVVNNYHYDLHIDVPVGGDLTQAGRQIISAIQQYERVGSASWRSGGVAQ